MMHTLYKIKVNFSIDITYKICGHGLILVYPKGIWNR